MTDRVTTLIARTASGDRYTVVRRLVADPDGIVDAAVAVGAAECRLGSSRVMTVTEKNDLRRNLDEVASRLREAVRWIKEGRR